MTRFLLPHEIKELPDTTILLDASTGRRCRKKGRHRLSGNPDPLVLLYMTDDMTGYTHEARTFINRFKRIEESR